MLALSSLPLSSPVRRGAWLTALFAGAVGLSGCKTAPVNGATEPGPRVGPSLARLYDQLTGSKLTQAEKDEYWRTMQGRLVSATGPIQSLSESIRVEADLSETRPETVWITAYPDKPEEMSSLKPGQVIQVTGRLSDKTVSSEPGKTAFILRNARIRIK